MKKHYLNQRLNLLFYLILVVVVIVPVKVLADTDNLSVKIKIIDEKGKPLDNVVIIAGKRMYVSGEDGYFSIDSSREQDISLTLYRTGYRMIELNSLPANRIITMESVPFNLSSVKVKGEMDSSGDKIIIPISGDLASKTLPDILGSYGDITGSSLSGEKKTLSLGGHHSRHLLVLMDGVPLNKMGQPVDLLTIPVGIIERVEIIKGGSTAEKGGVGGVINLHTKQGGGDSEYSLRQDVGSFGYVKSGLSISKGTKSLWFDFLAEASYARNDFSYTKNGETHKREFNDKAFQNLYLKTVYRFSNTLLDYKVNFHLFQNKLPGPVNYLPQYRDARLEGYGINNDLLFKTVWDYVSLEAQLYHRQDETEYDNTRTDILFSRMKGTHFDEKKGAKLKVNYENDFINYLSLRQIKHTKKEADKLRSNDKRPTSFNANVTIEYNREDFRYEEVEKPKNSIPAIYSENNAIKLEADVIVPILTSLAISSWRHNAAFRYDNTNLWDDNQLGRYLTSIEVEDIGLIAGVSYGNNYSLPSFYDLYWQGDSQTTGNPDLKPESSQSFHLFSELNRIGFTLSASYETSKIDNLIYWYRGVTGWKPGNIGTAEINDLSLSLNIYRFEKLKLSFSYSEIDALNKTKNVDGSKGDFYGKYLPYRPENRFFAELQTNLNIPLMLKVAYSYTGKQHSTLDQLIAPLPAYGLTNLEAGYNVVRGNWDYYLSVSLKNIFNVDYEIYHYTPQPGFNWLFNLKVTLK